MQIFRHLELWYCLVLFGGKSGKEADEFNEVLPLVISHVISSATLVGALFPANQVDILYNPCDKKPIRVFQAFTNITPSCSYDEEQLMPS